MKSRGGATLESLMRKANEESTLFVFEICDLCHIGEKQIKRHLGKIWKNNLIFLKRKNWTMATFYAPTWATQKDKAVVSFFNKYIADVNAIHNYIQFNEDGHVITKDHLLELDGI